MDQPDRDLLRRMLLERSMRFGEFVLSSGATSNYYIDVRKTSLHPEGLRLISHLFYDIMQSDNVTAVGGLTLGADPLVAGLMLYSAAQGKPLEGFLVRRTTKDHGLRGQVEGNLAGHKRVVVLDEPFNAVDTKTAADLCDLVKRWHAEKRTVIAALHDLDLVKSMFPEALLLARELVAWGATREVLTAENLLKARRMCEAFDEHAEACAA